MKLRNRATWQACKDEPVVTLSSTKQAQRNNDKNGQCAAIRSNSTRSDARDIRRWVLVITLFSIGGTIVYLKFRESPLSCYEPVRGKVCYSKVPESDRYKWFATKTDYNRTIQEHRDQTEKPIEVTGCQPILFYLFQRHTTRYPDRKDILEANNVLEKLVSDILLKERSRFCKDDLQEFSIWVPPFVPDQDNMVSPQGNRITEEQVIRFKKRFPSTFSVERPFQASTITVDFTSRNRSRDTAYTFMKQWFTKDVFEAVIEPQISQNVNDPVLQFHKTCSDFLKKSGRLVKMPPAVATLEASPYYSSLLENLSSRLGRKITKAEMKIMYKQCAFEMAIVGTSPWCAVFTAEDLKLLEFREDLDDYYTDAYGNDVNWRQACKVAVDLFDHIDEVESPSYASNFTRTVLHFSHAGALKKILAYFRIGEGPAVNWNAAVCEHHNWRSSKFCPFNANLLFILYKCSNKQSQIVTLLNEKIVQLSGCSSRFCPLNEFRELFQRWTSSCDLSEICS